MKGFRDWLFGVSCLLLANAAGIVLFLALNAKDDIAALVCSFAVLASYLVGYNGLPEKR